jgi:hypothetical protein
VVLDRALMRRLPVSLNYATHLPALMRALERSGSGPVLELGMGLFSTPYLHYACALAGRYLVSLDNNAEWAQFFINAGYESKEHNIFALKTWDEFALLEGWAVALVDHSPSDRRIVDIRRLAAFAHYIVVHDTNGRYDREYHYSEIYPLFKWRTDWTGDHRHACVLSNFHDLGDFWA